jgi:PQQ-like domain
VNTEERQLSDLLHRVTPEPPRGVTVEDVALRLANQAGRQGQPRPRPRWGRAWAPALAAASVVVVAGVSAGVAMLATSHNNPPSSTSGSAGSASTASSPAASSSSLTQQTTSPASPATRIPGAPWSAELVTRHGFTQNSLVSGDGSLYAIEAGALARIDPATGTIVQTAPVSSSVPNPPVVLGGTVWVVSTYSGGNVVLHSFDAQTLAPGLQVSVPALGGVSPEAQGVLTSGPDGNLYVASGDAVVVVNPADGQVVRRILLSDGPAVSVAVSPNGRSLYVGVVHGGAFRLLAYDLASETITDESSLSGTGGNLLATSGGVWGTLGNGNSEWAWFAPSGDLTASFRVGPGAGGGLGSFPTLSGGVVWIGGTRAVACASSATGQVLATATIPTDNGAVEYFGSVAAAGHHAYAEYQNQAAQQFGLARMTPPLMCGSGGSGGAGS